MMRCSRRRREPGGAGTRVGRSSGATRIRWFLSRLLGGCELMELSLRLGVTGVIGSDIDRCRWRWRRTTRRRSSCLRRRYCCVPMRFHPGVAADVILADPARRTGSGRVFRPDQLTPLFELITVYAGRPLIVKCAPGLDHQNHRDKFGFDGGTGHLA